MQNDLDLGNASRCPNCFSPVPGQMNLFDGAYKCLICRKSSDFDALLPPGHQTLLGPPPVDMRVNVLQASEDCIELEQPRRGFDKVVVFMLLFWLVWMGFTTGIPVLSSGLDWWALLFCIPFWAFGIFLLAIIINLFSERQTLKIAVGKFRVQKQRIIRPKLEVIDLKSIKDVVLSPAEMLGSNAKVSKGNAANAETEGELLLVPTVIYEGGRLQFFLQANATGRRWVVEALRAVVPKMQRSAW